MKKDRKHYTAEEKVSVLRRHLLDKVPVSELCEEHFTLSQDTCSWRGWRGEVRQGQDRGFSKAAHTEPGKRSPSQ